MVSLAAGRVRRRDHLESILRLTSHFGAMRYTIERFELSTQDDIDKSLGFNGMLPIEHRIVNVRPFYFGTS